MNSVSANSEGATIKGTPEKAESVALAATYPSLAYSAYALALLFLATFFSLLDRFLVGLLTTPIKREMVLSDTQISLLQGLAFVALYALFGLFFGRLVDRHNRRNIIIVGMVIWCLMTVLCGVARNYTELFIARLGVGIGEACLAPAAYSLITDYFRPKYHGRALAIFTMGSVFGGGGSYILGGMVYTALQGHPDFALPVLGAMAPWRATFVLVGLPGLLVAVLLLSIREPMRQVAIRNENDIVAAHTNLTLRGYLRLHGTAVYLVIAFNSCIAIVGTGVTSWMPTFLIRTYGVEMSWVGHSIGFILIGSSLVAALFGGTLADSAFIARCTGKKLNVSLLGTVLTVPFLVAFPLASSPTLCLVLFALEAFLINIAICVAPSVLQDIVPNQLKGQITALYWMVMALIGLGVGPSAIALVTDYLFRDETMLRYSMIVVAAPAMMTAAVMILIARKFYQAAIISK